MIEKNVYQSRLVSFLPSRFDFRKIKKKMKKEKDITWKQPIQRRIQNPVQHL